MKKGLLVVSFGSSYLSAIERAILPTEEYFQQEFPEYKVYRTFTSKRIREKIENRDDIHVDSPAEAFERMKSDGIEEVLVQPLQFVPGEEYRKIMELVEEIREKKDFKRVALGRSLLHFNGQEGRPDDYKEVVEIVSQLLPDPEPREALILMGHGSPESPNVAYELLGHRLQQRWPWIYMATVEGGPDLKSLIPRLKAEGYRNLHLIPFMWVAGDHAMNDMAGDEEDSWRYILENEGFSVQCHMMGLGERSEMRKIFIRRAQDALLEE